MALSWRLRGAAAEEYGNGCRTFSRETSFNRRLPPSIPQYMFRLLLPPSWKPQCAVARVIGVGYVGTVLCCAVRRRRCRLNTSGRLMTPCVESALFQLLERTSLSSRWFQMSTCAPTARAWPIVAATSSPLFVSRKAPGGNKEELDRKLGKKGTTFEGG